MQETELSFLTLLHTITLCAGNQGFERISTTTTTEDAAAWSVPGHWVPPHETWYFKRSHQGEVTHPNPQRTWAGGNPSSGEVLLAAGRGRVVKHKAFWPSCTGLFGSTTNTGTVSQVDRFAIYTPITVSIQKSLRISLRGIFKST